MTRFLLRLLTPPYLLWTVLVDEVDGWKAYLRNRREEWK